MTAIDIKHIQVTCAIIERDSLVLAAQRSAIMAMPYKWELPGGKIDPGETPAECLRREILEELGVRLVIGGRLPAVTHDYPTFRITLHPFMACIETGEIVLHEHAAMIWLPPEKLPTLDWAEADLPVIRSYFAHCGVTRR